MSQELRFENVVHLQVRAGDTGAVLAEHEAHNDISDDMMCSGRQIYLTDEVDDPMPYCFLLKDGPLWTGFTWNQRNPWAPYCYVPNNLYNGVADASANPHWAPHARGTFVNGRWKLFYQWTQLADDLQLKAIGLTGWDNDHTSYAQRWGCITNAWSVITPQSLITLPTPILVRGRKGGSQVQDILEISYYLSVVGVN